MKYKIFSFVIFLYVSAFSQTRFCYPDGRIVSFQAKTIGGLLDSAHIKADTLDISRGNDDVTIFYKKFTDIPVIAMLHNGKGFAEYKAALKKRTKEYKTYLSSGVYYYDLSKLKKDDKYNPAFFLNTFGKPDSIIDNGAEKTWFFFSFNLKVHVLLDEILSLDVINVNAIKKAKLKIEEYSIFDDDYGMGFSFSMTNYHEKDIKYIYITVTAKNDVDDKIGTKTVRAIGPIYSGMSDSYSFDKIFYTHVASYMAIDKIKVQFFDGTIKTLSEKDVDAIICRRIKML